MRGKLHLALGVCGGLIGAYAIQNRISEWSFFHSSVFVCGTAIGSLFPDIDIPTSTLGRIVQPLSLLINKFFGHRGLFHAPIFYFGAWLAARLLIFEFGIYMIFLNAFLYGVSLHLIQDMMTGKGIMAFYPWKKRVSLVSVPSGHYLNYPCTAALILILIGLWI